MNERRLEGKWKREGRGTLVEAMVGIVDDYDH